MRSNPHHLKLINHIMAEVFGYHDETGLYPALILVSPALMDQVRRETGTCILRPVPGRSYSAYRFVGVPMAEDQCLGLNEFFFTEDDAWYDGFGIPDDVSRHPLSKLIRLSSEWDLVYGGDGWTVQLPLEGVRGGRPPQGSDGASAGPDLNHPEVPMGVLEGAHPRLMPEEEARPTYYYYQYVYWKGNINGVGAGLLTSEDGLFSMKQARTTAMGGLHVDKIIVMQFYQISREQAELIKEEGL